MDGVLVIIPCGQAKVWDDDPQRGPTPAREAYTGAPFKVNRAYAERHAGRWVILSAKHGFIRPDFPLPGPYNVTFKKRETSPVDVTTLRGQIREQGLDEFRRIVGLGGKEYRAAIEEAFAPFGSAVEFPFAGLPIGLAMQAVKRATEGSTPPVEARRVPEFKTTISGGKVMARIKPKVRRRESVVEAIEEFDSLGVERFLEKYEFGHSRRYFLAHEGRLYDSKAILGAAYGFENPSDGPLRWNNFCGGRGVQRRLEALGFEVRILDEAASHPTEAAGDVDLAGGKSRPINTPGHGGQRTADDGGLARRGSLPIGKVNLNEKLALFHDHWSPKVVGELNGQHVKLVKFRGEFVWHRHDHEDELFLVVKGRFVMEFRDRQVRLEEGEFLIVPRGIEHRPVAQEEVHVLLFEPAGTLNTGDVQDERTVREPERI